MIQASPYQVERLDWVGRKAFVRAPTSTTTPTPSTTRRLKILDRFEARPRAAATSAHGEVHLVRRFPGYKKIRYYTHDNIGYGHINLPDPELHTTAVWWQLSQPVLDSLFASKQDALDGFLGAAYALHVIARIAVMADGADLQKAVGSGDGAWFAVADAQGRGQLRRHEGPPTAPDDLAAFTPTIYLYDNFPGGVGLAEPLWTRQAELSPAPPD